MFNYELPLEPSCDEILEYRVPELIREICLDILERGSSTSYQKIYDFIFEEAQEEILKQEGEACLMNLV